MISTNLLEILPCSAHRLSVASFLAALGLSSTPAAAQNVATWRNTSGYYHAAQNWSGYTVPGPADMAAFPNHTSPYSVWWNAQTASLAPSVGKLQVAVGAYVNFINADGTAQHQLTVNGSGGNGDFNDLVVNAGILAYSGLHLHSLGGGTVYSGILNLNGAHAKGTKLTVDGAVGFDVSGSLLLQSGAIFDNTVGYIGRLSGSTGTATVNGSGSQWNNSGALTVGDGGTGTLNVQNGGVVRNTWGNIGRLFGSTGTATVTGSGSQWNNSGVLRVGEEGTGTLNVVAGGVVSNTASIIADVRASTGSATVTGSGSQWNNSGVLTVGEHGTGTLNVEAGGVVSSAAGKVAARSGSRGIATVTGSGSQWINSGNLIVCDSGNGNHATLNVEAGGVVSNRKGEIGLGESGTVQVTGIGSQWNNSDSLTVGNTGKATLNIEAGGVVRNTRGYIGVNWLLASGFSFVTRGVATVTGSGSQWINSHSLFLGGNETEDGDPGTLNVSNRGNVHVGNDRYTPPASSLAVSDTGEAGILEVRNGSKINNAGISTIGYSAGSSGSATVTGSGSQWNSGGGLIVGYSGHGTLSVEAGAVANDAIGVIGHLPGSTGAATVTGSGSQWNSSSFLLLGTNEANGDGGVGTLDVLDSAQVNVGNDLYGATGTAITVSDTGTGGSLSIRNGSKINNSGLGVIGLSSGSGGTATVTGSGSQWNNSGDLDVAKSGNGTLTVEAGGAASNRDGIIGSLSGSTGTATVTGNGSLWNNSRNLGIGGSRTTAGGTGTLTIDDLGQVNVTDTTRLWGSGSAVIDDGGILETGTLDLTLGSFQMLNGGLLMADAVLGNLQNTSGVLAPGHSPGTMSISGNYQQGAAATLQIELGGTVPGSEHDRLNVAGTITLGGLLEVKLVNGFVPAIGQSFDILDAASITGNFSNVVLPALPLGLFWRTDALVSQGVLQVALVPATFAEFATAYGLTLGETGDDDGDRVSNVMEFLRGSNPSDPASVPWQSFTRNGQQSVFSFTLPELPPGAAQYALKSSSDLIGWSTLATKSGTAPWSMELAIDPPVNGRVTITFEEAISNTRRFYLLVATPE